MGKGDKKTKRGKIIMGSYGKVRPRNVEKAVVIPVKPKKAKVVVEEVVEKKVVAKKAPAKKEATAKKETTAKKTAVKKTTKTEKAE